EHVDVSAAGDDPCSRRIRADRSGGTLGVVVGDGFQAVGLHDGEVVLGLVGVGVLTLAPLGDRFVIGRAHDRCPVALAPVVGGGGGAVVAESAGVSCFVAGGLGDELLVIPDAVLEHE